MRPSAPAPRQIPVKGFVGAGAIVEVLDDQYPFPKFETVDIPPDGEVEALVVRGESQWPRFLDGEIILYDPRPAIPADLVDQYAVVQTKDGRKLIKVLRRGVGADRWRLDTHNAKAEEDVELIGAWRYLGVLPARHEGAEAAARVRAFPRRRRGS
jgi:phage repressor protein C with HTH and peptisase S24 domain